MFSSTYTLVESEYTQFRQWAKYMFLSSCAPCGQNQRRAWKKIKAAPFVRKERLLFITDDAHNRKSGRQRRRAGLGLTLHALVTVNGEITEFLFDAEELVVLGHTVGTAERTGLDLTRVRSYSDVSDRSIFRLTRAV